VGWFSLTLAPFIAVGNSGEVHDVVILVANFDGEDVGSNLSNFLLKLSGSKKYFLTFLETEAKNQDELASKVLGLEAWGAIFSTKGASQRLVTAFSNGCMKASRYKPQMAISWVFDQGRSPGTAKTISNIITSTILPQFISSFSGEILQSNLFNSSYNLESCLIGKQASFVTKPVDYLTTNLTFVEPCTLNAITVGNIAIAVFASLFVVNLTLKHTVTDVGLASVSLFFTRAAFISLCTFGLGGSFSTIVICVANQNDDGIVYGGNVWIKVVLIQWLHGMIWAYAHSSIAVGISPNIVPFIFVFLLFSNIIGGWNIDFANGGYTTIYQIFPFHWSMNLMKWVLFGSLGSVCVLSAAVLAGVCICMFFVFGFVSLRTKKIQTTQTSTSQEAC